MTDDPTTATRIARTCCSDAMTHWEDPLYTRIIASLPAGTRPSDFITSLDLSARSA